MPSFSISAQRVSQSRVPPPSVVVVVVVVVIAVVVVVVVVDDAVDSVGDTVGPLVVVGVGVEVSVGQQSSRS